MGSEMCIRDRAYTQASVPLKDLAATHKTAAAEAKAGALLAGNSWDAADRMIAQAGHSVVGSVTNMAGTVKGLGAGAFTGLKSAAGGVIDYFGGPWAVGIAAATGVVLAVVDANRRAEDAQRQMAQAAAESAEVQRELAAAVAGTTGELNAQALEAAAKAVDNSMTEFIATGEMLDGFISKVDTAAMRQAQTGKEQREANREARETKKAYKELKDTAEDLGISMEDLGTVVAEGGRQYNELQSNLRGSGEAGNAAADELEAAREKMQATIDAARNMEPSFAQAASAVDVLADSAASGEDKLSALEKLMESMGLVPKMAEEALMDTADAVDKMVESAVNSQLPVETLGDALFGLDGKLEPTNASSRLLHDNLTDLRHELQQAAVSGADTQEAFDLMQPALQSLKEQFGLTDDQLQELINSYGSVSYTHLTLPTILLV